MLLDMLFNEGVIDPDCLAKYAAALFRETLIKAALPGFFVREAATPKFASS